MNRENIDEFIETQIAGDTNPPKSDRSAEVAESYVAQEISDMEAQLAAKYDNAVKHIMMLTGKSTDNEIGKRFYETMAADKEKYITAAIKQTLDNKGKTIADAPDVLEEIIESAAAN